jgi:hypothetical protein
VNLKSQASSLKPARQIPIEQVPLGARVPTKNPNRYEVDPQPEPDQATWAKLSITVERSDGGIVDAELIRPRAWIRSVGIEAGKLLPINIEELQVKGSATVTSIDDCPEIADGEGSVVTARFITREVHVVASVDIQGPDGSIETITGTPIHPIWSVDRQEWVPLGELIEGEALHAANGIATVLSLALVNRSLPVYNVEIHGEHVYQVGEFGLLVHNSDVCTAAGRKLTEHAQESLIRHGFRKPFNDVDNVVDNAKWILKQPDGGSVYLLKESGRGRLYSMVVDGSTGIVTAMKNLTPKELSNLARNYGFPLPW